MSRSNIAEEDEWLIGNILGEKTNAQRHFKRGSGTYTEVGDDGIDDGLELGIRAPVVVRGCGLARLGVRCVPEAGVFAAAGAADSVIVGCDVMWRSSGAADEDILLSSWGSSGRRLGCWRGRLLFVVWWFD